MKSPRVGIIVVNYNGGQDFLACLSSLFSLEYSEKQIIIVDNASTDQSFSLAKENFSEGVFLRNETNEGFAKAANKGMRYAFARGARWCWIVNNDATVDPFALKRLVESGEKDERNALISPTIYTENGALWFGKGVFDFWRMKTRHVVPTKKERTEEFFMSEFVTGCALLVRKEFTDRQGFFDERFFLYYEDADLSYRAKQGGFLSLVVPKAIVWHREVSRQNPQKVYYLILSGLLFFQKNAFWWQKPYFFLHGTMRRVKNIFLKMLFPRDLVLAQAQAAYRQYFHGIKTKL
ncbi:MAG: glycosyltransferase family 2 protein [Candidatus Moranbacteria bacterium]|nr:glycosyltransferase family 2 protein [Candidatus Moranbacteria bacterium]